MFNQRKASPAHERQEILRRNEEQLEGYIETIAQHAVPDWISGHLHAYAETPAKAHMWDATFAGGRPDTPTLLLTTTGRKAGRQIAMPLIYGVNSDRHIIVASTGGTSKHPAWFLNLQAYPEVSLQAVEKSFVPFRALPRAKKESICGK